MGYLETYKIPEDIKDALTDGFYDTFRHELIKVFPEDAVCGVDQDLFPIVYHLGSTCGWCDALKEACFLCGLDSVWKYYSELEWFDSDRFDGEIEIEFAKRFSKAKKADIVRTMSDDELADFLTYGCEGRKCPEHGFIASETEAREMCRKCWLEWLRQDSGEEVRW